MKLVGKKCNVRFLWKEYFEANSYWTDVSIEVLDNTVHIIGADYDVITHLSNVVIELYPKEAESESDNLG